MDITNHDAAKNSTSHLRDRQTLAHIHTSNLLTSALHAAMKSRSSSRDISGGRVAVGADIGLHGRSSSVSGGGGGADLPGPSVRYVA